MHYGIHASFYHQENLHSISWLHNYLNLESTSAYTHTSYMCKVNTVATLVIAI